MTEAYQPVDEVLRRAAELGAETGRSAASWATDGNTTHATYKRILVGIENSDPAVLDAFRTPSLSGEWADEVTPADLADALDYDADDAAWLEIQDDVCTAWEEAAQDAFWATLEADCRRQVTS